MSKFSRQLYVLDGLEETTVLLLRISHWQHMVLFGFMEHDKAVKKIKKARVRIEALGGNPYARIKVEEI